MAATAAEGQLLLPFTRLQSEPCPSSIRTVGTVWQYTFSPRHFTPWGGHSRGENGVCIAPLPTVIPLKRGEGWCCLALEREERNPCLASRKVNCQLKEGKLPTEEGKLPTEAGKLPTEVNCKLRKVNYQLSKANCQLRMVNCQLRKVNCQLKEVKLPVPRKLLFDLHSREYP